MQPSLVSLQCEGGDLKDLSKGKAMAETMRAAVLRKVGEVVMEDRPVPRPGPGEVLVRVRAVGVCGSDVHYFVDGRIGHFVVEKPIILGHECAGEVAELGEGVDALTVGDPVAVEPGWPCGRCAYCRNGRYNLCPDVFFLATPPDDGAFCDYLVAPAAFAFKLPEGMSFAEGAMMEPLAVGVHAVRRAGVTAGSSVVVTGAGTIGLLTMQSAGAFGATRLFISDVFEKRLALAKELGAEAALNAKEVDVVAEVTRATVSGVDFAFECAGAKTTVNDCIAMLRPGGTLTLVGMTAEGTFPVNVHGLLARELDVRTVFRYANCYPLAIELARTGRVQLEPLITHRFPLEETHAALTFAHEQKSEAIKVVVEL